MALRVKRATDIVGAAAGGTLLLPVLAAAALAVRLRSGRPVLFRQPRPGWRAKVFKLYKFRTMTEARDAGGALLPDGDR